MRSCRAAYGCVGAPVRSAAGLTVPQFGVLGFVFIAFLSNYTMKILVASKYRYQEQYKKCETFIDVGTHAAGPVGRILVQFAQIGSQLGTCSIYIVYIAQVRVNSS